MPLSFTNYRSGLYYCKILVKLRSDLRLTKVQLSHGAFFKFVRNTECILNCLRVNCSFQLVLIMKIISRKKIPNECLTKLEKYEVRYFRKVNNHISNIFLTSHFNRSDRIKLLLFYFVFSNDFVIK